MGRLIDQFIGGQREWARITGHPEDALLMWPVVWTGAAWGLEPIERVDPASLPPSQRDTLTVGDVAGHHTLDQLRSYLDFLVERLHFDEEFLIPALISGIERELERLSEDYGR